MVYTDQLVPVNFDSLVKTTPVVFVTGTSCGGCVEYFSKQKITKTFVYFIDHLSIMEMSRVKVQDDPTCNFYYALKDFNSASIKAADKSPIMMFDNSGEIKILNYSELDTLTKSYTKKGKSVRKSIKSM